MRLKDAAGWNQTESDWRNLLALEPDGCFGVDCEGRLAATTTAVCYGRELAWIGMVLTHPELRGRGLARALMERAIAWVEARGIEWIKLDATDMGRPLYLKLGFVDEASVERWRLGAASAASDRSAGLPRHPLPFALDREAFGADRCAMLRGLEQFEVAACEDAYGMGRPGTRAAYFGPCVSRTPDAARELLEWFLSRCPGEPVFWDLLPENANAVALAREFGFEPVRRLIRMVRPGVAAPRPCTHRDDYVYAIAGFEYG
jgi:hypothetical protein